MASLRDRISRWWRFRKTWRTPVGQDCISLDRSLALWLGVRLTFLADNAMGAPINYSYEEWTTSLRNAGAFLLAYADDEFFDDETAIGNGKQAMAWVAKNFRELWD